MIRRSTSLRLGAVDFADEDVDACSTITASGRSLARTASSAPTTGLIMRAHKLLKQRLLVLEVEIDRALGDAGAPRHVVEPRGGKAARGEFVERRLQDCASPLRRLGGAHVDAAGA